jgi:hypothetical protein
LNDAGLREDDEDEAVEADELEEEQESDRSEHVLGAEPAQVQYLVERKAPLDEDEGEESFLGLGAD